MRFGIYNPSIVGAFHIHIYRSCGCFTASVSFPKQAHLLQNSWKLFAMIFFLEYKKTHPTVLQNKKNILCFKLSLCILFIW